jgi:hypothetical protein
LGCRSLPADDAVRIKARFDLFDDRAQDSVASTGMLAPIERST